MGGRAEVILGVEGGGGGQVGPAGTGIGGQKRGRVEGRHACTWAVKASRQAPIGVDACTYTYAYNKLTKCMWDATLNCMLGVFYRVVQLQISALIQGIWVHILTDFYNGHIFWPSI